ncbi:MAG: NADH-quinone oxidoreductase subunit D [Armatimonadetes bacterium]|nr:NADH-quinone oxidoreductase subunit D [Armatimonadota bacterium]
MKPELTGREIDSFYHLSDAPVEHRSCRGISCFAGKILNPEGWQQALSQWPPVYCLGKCYASPATTEIIEQPRIEIHCPEGIVLDGVADQSKLSVQDYGYAALRKALRNPAEAVVAEIEASQLRGRGGAGFPAGKKWRAVFNEPGATKYVVANADEGDHGSYIDRFIMERTPHRLIESLALAGYAVGASKGYIYLRKEYPVAEVAVRKALLEAEEAGWLGADIYGSSFSFEIEVVIGQGSYVCGEETSLLNSIEHRRPEVRSRPPFPTQSGLFGAPTLVNNVETLASVPWIVLNGGEAYAEKGFSTSRGTKAISLNSLFNQPGLYEIEFGMPLRTILEVLGGGLKTGDFKAVIVGGPLTGLVHPREFGTLFGFDEMHAIGASIGHGGIVAFDQHTRMDEFLAHVFEFGAIESCGKCTPCRLGSRRAQVLFANRAEGGCLSAQEESELKEILDAIRRTSLCGHGTGLAAVAASVFEKFGEEF